ncbi:hypothetical protein KI387_006388, partial [Taxus chinensis]
MGIDQTKLNNLAVASDLGKLIGWVSGMACMVLPTWAVLGIAVSLGMMGYGLQWLVVSAIIKPLPYWVMYILCMMAGNSICWLNTVCFRVAISNFPDKRGIASGLSTSYSGLSTVIYTNLSRLINPNKPSLYLLLNAFVPVVVCGISVIFIRIPQPNAVVNDEGEGRDITYIFTFIAIVTAVYSIVFEFLPHGENSREGAYMAVLVFLLLSLLYVPLKAALCGKKLERSASTRVTDIEKAVEMHRPREKINCGQYIQDIGALDIYVEYKEFSDLWRQNSKDGDALQQQNLAETNTEQEMQQQNPAETNPVDNTEQEIITSADTDILKKPRFLKPVPPVGEEHGALQLLRSLDFWLYYFVYFCGGTVGLVYINNLGQITQSLGYSKTPKLASLVSSFGFLGRIASGLPDYFQSMTRGFPRPAWLGIWTLPLVPALFMLAFLDQKQSVLYGSTAIIGTCAGAITSVAVPTSSELFGMEHFGVNHNILISNIAFGSLLFGGVAGVVYDRSASSSSSSSSTATTCLGRACY